MNERKKPLILEMEEAGREIEAFISETVKRHGLSFYFAEKLMTGINSKIAKAAQDELSAVTAVYSAAAEAKNKKREDNNGTDN